jgi:hypothetical protein
VEAKKETNRVEVEAKKAKATMRAEKEKAALEITKKSTGVTWCKKTSKWLARMRSNEKQGHVGSCECSPREYKAVRSASPSVLLIFDLKQAIRRHPRSPPLLYEPMRTARGTGTQSD